MVLAPAESRAVRLSLSGITKPFPGVIANQDISLDIRAGQISQFCCRQRLVGLPWAEPLQRQPTSGAGRGDPASQ